MTAVTSSLRSIRTPLQALARRQYSVAAAGSPQAQAPVVVGYSNRSLAVACGISAMAGADVTFAYFTLFQKKDTSA